MFCSIIFQIPTFRYYYIQINMSHLYDEIKVLYELEWMNQTTGTQKLTVIQ